MSPHQGTPISNSRQIRSRTGVRPKPGRCKLFCRPTNPWFLWCPVAKSCRRQGKKQEKCRTGEIGKNIHDKHYSTRAEEACAGQVQGLIVFHGRRQSPPRVRARLPLESSRHLRSPLTYPLRSKPQTGFAFFCLRGDAISQQVVKKPNKNNDTILRLPEG